MSLNYLFDGTNTDSILGQARNFTLEEIREINSETYMSGVPGMANPRTIEAMNKMSVERWKDPMNEFLSVTYNMTAEHLLRQMENAFLPYKQTRLYTEMRDHIVEFLNNHREGHFKLAYENYVVEHQKPFTMATDAYACYLKDALEAFTVYRRERRISAYVEYWESIEDGAKRIDRKKVTENEIGEDMFTKEIEVMAVCTCTCTSLQTV